MKNMIRFYFGVFVGNTILAPVGFMGPGPDWPGIGATVLALGSLAVVTFLYRLDLRTRRNFMTVLTKFHTAAMGHPQLREQTEKLIDDLMVRESLVDISHEVGYLHSELVQRDLIPPDKLEIVKDSPV